MRKLLRKIYSETCSTSFNQERAFELKTLIFEGMKSFRETKEEVSQKDEQKGLNDLEDILNNA